MLRDFSREASRGARIYGSFCNKTQVVGASKDYCSLRKTRHLKLRNLVLFFLSFLLFRAALVIYGSSQVRGPITAAAAGLYLSHSNARSEAHLQPTPQLMATPAP